ncbi:DEAD-box ATP-dependent RNA helicase 30 [Apostasia shenzhenica]|uniref:DEAD-box ATP-dependent RNA helicase 30 n=1 Tax=Apostasia shenzhenica TaxID=1088818 RepID=A0A2H9ZW91_9ASPA|nr:DEAD-box ATP-dependent RNA helicase 30 [Apostasia shenzhenica]
MAKGDDALRRKKNKANRKRMRNGESSVPSRVAAIIASKSRRKAGKRRICEGMCFSLPTPEDPFNEWHEKKAVSVKNKTKKNNSNRRGNGNKDPKSARNTDRKLHGKHKSDSVKNLQDTATSVPERKTQDGSFGNAISKFLLLCLKAIEDAWGKEDSLNKDANGVLLGSSWGADFVRICASGLSIVETSGAFATRDQVAWIVSMAADIVTRKDKQGLVASGPFLLFLVSSQDRAVEVRSICKPLKALGLHTVSLHSGTSLDHQVHGLKSCEPEFLVSTPGRLLELVSLKAIDISGTCLLVLDGLKSLIDLGFLDTLKSIREIISMDAQVITFSDRYGAVSVAVLQQYLPRGLVYRLSADKSIANQSAFISQYAHFYTSEEEKMSEVLQILAQAFHDNQTAQGPMILLIPASACKADQLATFLKSKGHAVDDDFLTCDLSKADGKVAASVTVKDLENLQDIYITKFKTVIIVDFPKSIDDYVGILMKMAQQTLTGMLHSFFSEADSRLAQSFIMVLEQCSQVVPGFLRSL